MLPSSAATLFDVAGGTPFTLRGFTDHEHIDQAQLIHMNGRVYDYNLGRFLSIDPFVQAPGNSQSLNPYSYIMNNPLAGTDPSGYTFAQSSINCIENSGACAAILNGGLATTSDFNGAATSNGSAPSSDGSDSDVEAEEVGAPGEVGTNQSQNMTIEGFDNDRYNKHDDLIISIVDEINADKAGVIGATDEQAAGIGDIDPRMVKAWMIQESGGNDSSSKSAWDVDPLQANAYKRDWDKHKSGLGLKKSEAGAGDLKTNIRAGVIMMVRKGFGKSGQPPINRPSGTFDGFKTALRRYNGRTTPTTNGNPYSINYANRIMRRYTDTTNRVAISLPRPL